VIIQIDRTPKTTHRRHCQPIPIVTEWFSVGGKPGIGLIIRANVIDMAKEQSAQCSGEARVDHHVHSLAYYS
jgi:hypothetical protein